MVERVSPAVEPTTRAFGWSGWFAERRPIFLWWAGARALVLGTALVVYAVGRPYGYYSHAVLAKPFGALAVWDGIWYRRVAVHGYLFVPGHQSNGPTLSPKLARLSEAGTNPSHLAPIPRDCGQGHVGRGATSAASATRVRAAVGNTHRYVFQLFAVDADGATSSVESGSKQAAGAASRCRVAAERRGRDHARCRLGRSPRSSLRGDVAT